MRKYFYILITLLAVLSIGFVGCKNKPTTVADFGLDDLKEDTSSQTPNPTSDIKVVNNGYNFKDYNGNIFKSRDYNKLKEEGIIKNYADLLLYAAIIYSVDKYLGYVAPKPPSNILKEIAKNYAIEIVYIPLANFSSETLRKLRHFHVLGNRRLRSIAKDYII